MRCRGKDDGLIGSGLTHYPLIGAAQRVEHYEIAAYTTARNLALRLRQPMIVQLLTMSLGEEQNAGQLLDRGAHVDSEGCHSLVKGPGYQLHTSQRSIGLAPPGASLQISSSCRDSWSASANPRSRNFDGMVTGGGLCSECNTMRRPKKKSPAVSAPKRSGRRYSAAWACSFTPPSARLVSVSFVFFSSDNVASNSLTACFRPNSDGRRLSVLVLAPPWPSSEAHRESSSLRNKCP